MRILVVEDEKLLCDGIAEDLELEKYTVEQCYDGAKAYDLLLNEAFDLLILDLNLPGMDGLDLLRVARAEWPQLRVLILSARAGLSDRITGLDLGQMTISPSPLLWRSWRPGLAPSPPEGHLHQQSWCFPYPMKKASQRGRISPAGLLYF